MRCLGRVTDWLADYFLKKSRFVRSVLILASGSVLSQAVSLMAAPILTRLYSPDDFGVFAVYYSILGILLVMASLQLDVAIPLPENDIHAINLVALSLVAVSLTGLFTAFAISLFDHQIARLSGIPASHRYFWLIPVGLAITGVYQVFDFWTVRRKTFFLSARSRVHQAVTTAVTKTGLGLLGIGPIGLLSGDIAGRVWGVFVLVVSTLKNYKGTLKRIDRSTMAYCAIRYWRFPALSVPSSLLHAAASNLPALLLAGFFEPKIAGFFALSYRMVYMPSNLIGRAVGRVYFGEGAALVRSNIHGFKRLYLKTVFRLFLVGLLPTGFILLAGPTMFSVVFGPEWREAGIYARILAPAFLVVFCVSAIPNFAMLERLDLAFIWTVSYLALIISGFAVSINLSLRPDQTIMVLSGCMLTAYLVMFFFHILAIKIRMLKKTGT